MRADDSALVAHLRESNAYTEAMTAHLGPLRDEVAEELRSRLVDSDMSAPVAKGGWWYYSRTRAEDEYAVRCRAPSEPRGSSPGDGEQVVLDENELARGQEHHQLGVYDISPDGNLVAYGVDNDGDERFHVRFRRIGAGEHVGGEIRGASVGGAWDLRGSTFFYTTADEQGRPHQVWRHDLTTGHGTLVHTEADERFWVSVDLSRSEQVVFVECHSPSTSEVRYVPADDPTAAPRLVGPPRRDGVEFRVEHQGDRFLLLHNVDAPNFALSAAPVADTTAWTTLVPHHRDTRLLTIDAFRDHALVQYSTAGRRGVRVLHRSGRVEDLTFPDDVHVVHLTGNPAYDTDHVRVVYSTMATPPMVVDHVLATGEQLVRKRTVVPAHDPDRYRQSVEWARATDGTLVPITLLHLANLPLDGTGPGVLHGYGAYEEALDPDFDLARLSLVDRGIVFAIAHVRGGGELGRDWYEAGRGLAKRTSFTDFLACADHLVAGGWTAPGRLVALGASAGGLLTAAAATLSPGTFAGVVADVPFVDPLTTLLDPSLPLTPTDWEEFGNPLTDAEAYAYIKSYSPYENVPESEFPAVLALAALHDTRVGCHEPAKWVARLRSTARGGPFLLRTDMAAGHAGQSGRRAALRELAFTLAWILDVARAGEAR
jgi:oligopeptidase B